MTTDAGNSRRGEGSIACEDLSPDYGDYAKQETRSCFTRQPPDKLWRVISRFGTGGDFFCGNLLWLLRRMGDWLIGGPSLRRRRRHPDELRVGDVIDSWRVVAAEPGRRLTLLMEMKAPGPGVLEFLIDDEGKRRRVTMTAYFDPAGALGLAYWYALLPAHAYLFSGTVRSIASRAGKL